MFRNSATFPKNNRMPLVLVVIASSITSGLTVVYAASGLAPVSQGDAVGVGAVLALLLAAIASGPGVAWISAQLDKIEAFNVLASNAKLLIAVALSAVLGIGIYELAKALVTVPDVVAKIDEWLRVVWPVLTSVYSNLAHGQRKLLRVSPGG